VIKTAIAGDREEMSPSEAPSETPSAPVSTTVPRQARSRALVTNHFGFVWRSLLRLGVPRSDAEDALQQVFIIASSKLDDVEPGRERTFLFGVALRIASRAHRAAQRRREVLDGEPVEVLDPAPRPDELIDQARARAALDAILEAMPLDLRAVFVLYELERSTMAEIAELLELPAGTVASRLRRAREHFQAAVRRIEARGRS
jgi:RNA polymerase sigma-70 factor (ECF subfamily)